MSWLSVALVTTPFVVLMFWISWGVGELFAEVRCTCRKGAIHPDCPRHGWNREAA